MKIAYEIKRVLLLSVISFTCGILVRTIVINSSKPDFVFYRAMEPQFALVAENN